MAGTGIQAHCTLGGSGGGGKWMGAMATLNENKPASKYNCIYFTFYYYLYTIFVFLCITHYCTLCCCIPTPALTLPTG